MSWAPLGTPRVDERTQSSCNSCVRCRPPWHPFTGEKLYRHREGSGIIQDVTLSEQQTWDLAQADLPQEPHPGRRWLLHNSGVTMRVPHAQSLLGKPSTYKDNWARNNPQGGTSWSSIPNVCDQEWRFRWECEQSGKKPSHGEAVGRGGVRTGAQLGQAGTGRPRLTRGFFCNFWGLSLLLLLLSYKIKVSRMISSYPILQGLQPVEQVRGGLTSEDSAVLRPLVPASGKAPHHPRTMAPSVRGTERRLCCVSLAVCDDGTRRYKKYLS